MLTFMYTADYEDRDGLNDEAKLDLEESAAESSDTAAVDDNDKEPGGTTTPMSQSDFSKEKNLDAVTHTRDRVMVSALSNNLVVYTLADKYDVKGLKELSQTKFEIRSADEWEGEDILTIMPQVYKATPSTDRRLREVMLRVCLEQMDWLLEEPGSTQVLLEDAELTTELLKKVHWNSKHAQLEGILIRSRAAEVEKVKAWADTEEKTLKKIFLNTATCSGCGRPLDLVISNGSSQHWQQPISIKCRLCRHKYAPV
ncbi:MAG: hypothetical protein Q9220_000206 [cf. Caloplaca sp. 1 TL-2023]